MPLWYWMLRISQEYTYIDKFLLGLPYIFGEPTLICFCHALCNRLLLNIAPAKPQYLPADSQAIPELDTPVIPITMTTSSTHLVHTPNLPA